MNAGDNITGQNESHDTRYKGEDVDEKEIGPAEQDRYWVHIIDIRVQMNNTCEILNNLETDFFSIKIEFKRKVQMEFYKISK